MLYILWMPGMGYTNPIYQHFRTGNIMEKISEDCAVNTISHLYITLYITFVAGSRVSVYTIVQ